MAGNDPLTVEERAAAHAAYPIIVGALDGMSTKAAFALMGSVFTFILEQKDSETAHRAVDVFCTLAHDIITASRRH